MAQPRTARGSSSEAGEWISLALSGMTEPPRNSQPSWHGCCMGCCRCDGGRRLPKQRTENQQCPFHGALPMTRRCFFATAGLSVAAGAAGAARVRGGEHRSAEGHPPQRRGREDVSPRVPHWPGGDEGPAGIRPQTQARGRLRHRHRRDPRRGHWLLRPADENLPAEPREGAGRGPVADRQPRPRTTTSRSTTSTSPSACGTARPAAGTCSRRRSARRWNSC